MYRGVAYAHLRQPDADLAAFLARVPLKFSLGGGMTSVFLDGEDVTEKIRTPEISLLASSLSQDRCVRAYLTAMQREMGKDGGIVLEGRDTGSVVFPDAEIKFYLDADIEERARRRHLEFAARNEGGDLQKVKAEIEKRDRNDSERGIAPLVRPEGAVYVDTTGLSIEQVVETLSSHVRQAER
ncbi:MAG: Cytidylate kinase [Syntrophorhabdaceae bacterium PtaU1.Bin034]|jgi:cytidylate kinase|nr:MAG: Cytidylate kinase [Syntrophorhabdaceae bacterium PtaU1.Bin034]